MKDQVFHHYTDGPGSFQFNEKVAEVFEDMLDRSVPFYREMTRMTCEIIKDFSQKHQYNDLNVYDLGCSTGLTMLPLLSSLSTGYVTGIDNSQAMLNKARKYLDRSDIPRNRYRLIKKDLADMSESDMKHARAVISNFTMQFIEPSKRFHLLKKIFHAMESPAVFILSEKVKYDNGFMSDIFNKHYFDFKRRNGYSEMEIANKRDALEKVLIPLSVKEYLDMLKSAGFSFVETVFRWYQFVMITAVKD